MDFLIENFLTMHDPMYQKGYEDGFHAAQQVALEAVNAAKLRINEATPWVTETSTISTT